MAFPTCRCWTTLCVGLLLLAVVSVDVPPRYVLHQAVSTFSEAAGHCSPGGLTTLANQQEVSEVLTAVAASASPPGDFVFWIGLKKERKECVLPSEPLRGFRWIPDGSQESEEMRWMEEPQHTCTTVRCAALKGNFDGSSVTTWGLIPVSCKNSYRFICKLQNGETAGLPASPASPVRPATPEPEPETTEPQLISQTQEPTTSEPEPPLIPQTQEPTTSEPEPPLIPQTQEPTTSEPEPQTLRPSTPAPAVTAPATSQPERQAPEPEQPKVDPGPEPSPSSGPAPGSDSCPKPVIPGTRSLSLDSEDTSRVRVECWSSIRLDLSCSGQPAVWRMPDGSPANFSGLCRPCAGGFLKNAFGHCEDVDECSTGSPCRHVCLNTEGSFRCLCPDRNRLDNGTAPCDDAVDNGDALSGVLIPVLIAVAALVVLVVVVAVTVKCCLVRRSKKHAIKKAEKMGGLDSFETANEKAAT